MQVKDVMSKNPVYISPTTTLKEASEKMLSLDCGFIPVGEDDRLIGAITDRDITIRATAKGKDPNKTQVKEVMSQKIRYCFEEDDIAAAAKSMEQQHVHRLAVLNKNKRLTGILSLADLATKTHDFNLCGHLIGSLSETTH
jgi:CBS domain-containing protein